MTKRILITGATGFIGRHVVPRLEQDGCLLTLAVRTAETCPPLWRRNSCVRIVETGDLAQPAHLDAAFSDVSCVVHLAGLTNAGKAGEGAEKRFRAGNVSATRNLVDAAIRHRIATFVHLSSIFAVTDNVADRIIDDTTESTPSSAYGRSKREAEQCLTRLPDHGIAAISLRLPLVIGPQAKGNWAALEKLAATGLPLPFGSITNRRSLISVASAADVVAHLCARPWPSAASGAYALADPGPLSTADMMTGLRRGMDRTPRMIRCPPWLLAAMAALVGQSRRMASLLGSCEIDDTRFRRTFAYDRTEDLKETIRQCGAATRPSNTGSREQAA